MSINLNDEGLFSVEGVRAQRNNPDGTLPSPTRTVGGVTTFDASGLTSNAGDLSVRIDGGTPIVLNVDFSAATDPAAVTVTEAVAAITAAITTEPLAASVDATTGRVAIASTGSGETYMEVFNEVAGVLGFGGVETSSSLGTKIKAYFDSVTSLARAKNVKEGEEIEQEAGDGSLWVVRTSTIMKGEDITWNLLKDDDELKELVMGGVYDGTNFTYTYPTTNQTEQPKFNLESFVPKYSKGYQDRTDQAGYSKITHINCTGIEGDISDEAKAWAVVAYNINALEGKDVSGNKVSSVETAALSNEDFLNLGL